MSFQKPEWLTSLMHKKTDEKIELQAQIIREQAEAINKLVNEFHKKAATNGRTEASRLAEQDSNS